MGFGGCLVVPTPRERPDYQVVAEYQGLKLGRVSDAVPYLLGPRSIIDRIQAVLEHEAKFPATIYDDNYLSGNASPEYTDRDKALIAILSSLRVPEYVRLEKGDWYPQGLAARFDALLLYKHTAKSGVKTAHVTISEFHQMAQIWLLLPNPALVHGDYANVKNHWIDIASKLRERDVDISKIDLDLYQALTLKLEGEQLASKLDEIARWARDGTLDQRYDQYMQTVATQNTMTIARSIAAASSLSHTDARYSKRFTHKYPQGHTAQQRGAAMDAEQIKKQKEVAKMNALREKKRKRRNKCFFVAFMVLLFGGAVGSMLWAMGTRRWDFTQGGGQTG